MAQTGNTVDLTQQKVMPRDIRMVCLDLDGTLFNENSQITEEGKKQIIRCLDQGIHVFLVSGRAIEFTYKTACTVDPRVDSIGFAGAARYVDGKIHGDYLEKEVTEKILDVLYDEGCVTFIKKKNDVYCSHKSDLIIDYEKYTEDQPREHQIHVHENTDLRKLIRTDDGFYKMLIRSRGKLEKMKERLKPFENESRLFFYQVYGNIEAYNRNVDKGTAVVKAAAELGISKDRILGIGDSVNDIPLFEGCGITVAMGNAEDSVKEAADYITKSNREDGVAFALQQLIK